MIELKEKTRVRTSKGGGLGGIRKGREMEKEVEKEELIKL